MIVPILLTGFFLHIRANDDLSFLQFHAQTNMNDDDHEETDIYEETDDMDLDDESLPIKCKSFICDKIEDTKEKCSSDKCFGCDECRGMSVCNKRCEKKAGKKGWDRTCISNLCSGCENCAAPAAAPQTPIKISCWTKSGVYFYAGPAYSPAPGWSSCSSAWDAEFYAFSESEPGTAKITCYTKNGQYFYSGPGYTSSWPTCTSQGIVGADFYAFKSQRPNSALITCDYRGSTYFYSGPGYSSAWSDCSGGWDATWYAFKNPSDYKATTATQGIAPYGLCKGNGPCLGGTTCQDGYNYKEDKEEMSCRGTARPGSQCRDATYMGSEHKSFLVCAPYYDCVGFQEGKVLGKCQR